MNGLELPAATGDLGDALADILAALEHQLLGTEPTRPFMFSVEEDDGGYGAPAWSDIAGHVRIARATAEALGEGDVDAVAAIAHQMMHAIGSGAAFVRLEEQLLEEAIAETLAQCYLPAFLAAFGESMDGDEPLLQVRPNASDLQVAYPTAANVSVERFGRLAAWIEGADVDASDDELEAAALKWAVRLKQMPGADRFPVLASAAARLGAGGEDDDVGAVGFLEDYLRGYMKQLRRSDTGFAGLDYALARAWKDEAERPQTIPPATDEWRAEIEHIESITLTPLPRDGAIAGVLDTPVGPEVAAAAVRSLDARALLWSARQADAARVSDPTSDK